MRLNSLYSILTGFTLSGLAAACQPLPDPEVQGGYHPHTSCWMRAAGMCYLYRRDEGDIIIHPEHNLIIVTELSERCEAVVAEENARIADGRKTYGWERSWGNMNLLGNGLLVLTDVPQRMLDMLPRIPPWIPGCSPDPQCEREHWPREG